MFSWFKTKPREKEGCPAVPVVSVPSQVVVPSPLPKEDCVLGVEPAKDNDKLITLFWDRPMPGKVEQFLRVKFGEWYSYPVLKKVDNWVKYEELLESFYLRKKYGLEGEPLSFAIQARKSTLRCVYCHTTIEKTAQTCLQCGCFICLPCAPTLDGCPTPGCH